jgi:hypothetical protein
MPHAQWTERDVRLTFSKAWRVATRWTMDLVVTAAGHQAKRFATWCSGRWNFSEQADALRKALLDVDAADVAERVKVYCQAALESDIADALVPIRASRRERASVMSSP